MTLFCQVEREDEEKRRLVRKRREEGRHDIANRLVVGQLLIKWKVNNQGKIVLKCDDRLLKSRTENDSEENEEEQDFSEKQVIVINEPH